jgi:hypothetical protein
MDGVDSESWPAEPFDVIDVDTVTAVLKPSPIVATPKGHCHDTDQTACHSHCHVWMHRIYIHFIPETRNV